jgi:uncharacterized protein YodC (DUF2158 family)
MISCHDRSLGWDRYHVVKELVMDLKPGDVVILKSGGHPLSVVEVNDGKVVCVWMGNEGDLFRETLPLAVLELAEPEHEDDEDEDEDEDDEDDEEEEDEDDGKKA